METELTFRIILLVLIIAFVAHRGYYTRKSSPSDEKALKKRKEGMANGVANIIGTIALAATVIYILYPKWITIASLPPPLLLRWIGLAIAILGFALLQWAQNALGKNWSGTPRILKEQRLVTGGPYKWVRHPIYTAFLLILGATFFISANWLIGLSFTGMTVLEIASRIRFEESLMLEYFGADYREYMSQTGRFLPKTGRVSK